MGAIKRRLNKSIVKKDRTLTSLVSGLGWNSTNSRSRKKILSRLSNRQVVKQVFTCLSSQGKVSFCCCHARNRYLCLLPKQFLTGCKTTNVASFLLSSITAAVFNSTRTTWSTALQQTSFFFICCLNNWKVQSKSFLFKVQSQNNPIESAHFSVRCESLCSGAGLCYCRYYVYWLYIVSLHRQ